MYCPNCGKDNDGNKFCSNCGTLLDNQKVCNPVENSKSDDNKTISLVLGIICLIMSFTVSILCLIPGIISIVFAVKYKKTSGKLGVGFGLSLGGIIFSIVTFLLVLVVFLFTFNTISNVDYDDYYDYEYNDYYEYDNDYNSEFYYIPNIK